MTFPYHYMLYIWPMLAPAAFTVALTAYVWRRRTLALLVIPLRLHLLLVFTNDAHHWLRRGFSSLIPVPCEQEPTFAFASAGLRRVMLRAQPLVVSLGRQTNAPEVCTMRAEKIGPVFRSPGWHR